MPNNSEFVNFRMDRNSIRGLVHSSEVKDGLEILGMIAEASSKEHAPVDTGNLRRSITHEVDRDVRGLYMRWGTNVYYGIYQELGTRHHPAHPFLRPAMERLREVLRAP